MNSLTERKAKTRNLAMAAVLAALTTVMTAYVFHIPISATGGYIHFGDSLIYLSACLLPKPYAMAVGAIGGGVADLLTAPIWTLPTVIIKMLITLPFTNKGKKIITPRNAVVTIIAFMISAIGYFLAESLVFGYEIAFFTSIAGTAIQSLGSAAAFIVFGLALDKMNVKNKI